MSETPENVRQAVIDELRTKYGLTRVFCHEAFSPAIHEVADSYGYPLYLVQTYR